MSTRTLTTTLPSDTLYVSGTVNGVSTTWTNTEGNTWETVADRSPQDVYVVGLTIINQLGTATETTFTLYYGLHLVTDRTQADVTAKNDKGYYNASDLNRVSAAMIYLMDRLNMNGYYIDIDPKTDWSDSNIQDRFDMSIYLKHLRSIHEAFSLPTDTPEIPDSIRFLNYQSANNIEKILEIVDSMLSKSLEFLFYSGELYSEEV